MAITWTCVCAVAMAITWTMSWIAVAWLAVA
jgi:hypothetical protein